MNAKYFYRHNKNYLAVYIENYGFLCIHAVPSREIPFLSPLVWAAHLQDGTHAEPLTALAFRHSSCGILKGAGKKYSYLRKPMFFFWCVLRSSCACTLWILVSKVPPSCPQHIHTTKTRYNNKYHFYLSIIYKKKTSILEQCDSLYVALAFSLIAIQTNLSVCVQGYYMKS